MQNNPPKVYRYYKKLGINSQKFINEYGGIGVGYGPKQQETINEIKEEFAIKLYVEKKKTAAELKANGKPLDKLLNTKFGKLTTDVVVLGALSAEEPSRQKPKYLEKPRRPIVGGSSGALYVANREDYTGTLGMTVRGYLRTAGQYFILSNNHVLANLNKANPGDPVIQPGTFDKGNLKNKIGPLYRYIKLKFDDRKEVSPKINRVDAAIAEIKFEDVTREIFAIGNPRGWCRKNKVEEEMSKSGGLLKVQKTGTTSEHTTGFVTDLGYDGWIRYKVSFKDGSSKELHAYFEDQMLISPGDFSKPGDSGSIVLDMEERVIGLLFAGGPTHSIANHIEDVRNALPSFEFFQPEIE